MSSAIDNMAIRASNARIDKLQATVSQQQFVIAQLVSAVFHHVQDRHDAHMKTDDSPDVRAVVNARRAVQQAADRRSKDVASASRPVRSE